MAYRNVGFISVFCYWPCDFLSVWRSSQSQLQKKTNVHSSAKLKPVVFWECEGVWLLNLSIFLDNGDGSENNFFFLENHLKRTSKLHTRFACFKLILKI